MDKITYSTAVAEDLKSLGPAEQSHILDEIDYLDEKGKLAMVRAIRHKTPHKTTEDIL